MTNGAVALLRKRWASLIAWVAAMDYSAADYTNDRIRGLEREVEQLKDELRRTQMSAGAADGRLLATLECEHGVTFGRNSARGLVPGPRRRAARGFVAEHAFRGLGSADQALGYRAIVRFTAGQ
jgi:hypothetical protein